MQATALRACYGRGNRGGLRCHAWGCRRVRGLPTPRSVSQRVQLAINSRSYGGTWWASRRLRAIRRYLRRPVANRIAHEWLLARMRLHAVQDVVVVRPCSADIYSCCSCERGRQRETTRDEDGEERHRGGEDARREWREGATARARQMESCE